MATQSLLAVPSKATKSVDFTQPFLRFIGNNYDDQPSRYADAVGEFYTLRESTVVRNPDKHETGLELINRYVSMHSSREKIFYLPNYPLLPPEINSFVTNLLLQSE